MALQQLTHGEPNWDTKVNALISVVSDNASKLASFKPLTISGWSNEGVVLKGGFAFDVNSKGYRYITFPNGKLIETDFKFHTTGGVKGTSSTNVITIPDSVKNDSVGIDAGYWVNEKNVFTVRQIENKFSIIRNDNDANDEWNGSWLIHTLYMLS